MPLAIHTVYDVEGVYDVLRIIEDDAFVIADWEQPPQPVKTKKSSKIRRSKSSKTRAKSRSSRKSKKNLSSHSSKRRAKGSILPSTYKSRKLRSGSSKSSKKKRKSRKSSSSGKGGRKTSSRQSSSSKKKKRTSSKGKSKSSRGKKKKINDRKKSKSLKSSGKSRSSKKGKSKKRSNYSRTRERRKNSSKTLKTPVPQWWEGLEQKIQSYLFFTSRMDDRGVVLHGMAAEAEKCVSEFLSRLPPRRKICMVFVRLQPNMYEVGSILYHHPYFRVYDIPLILRWRGPQRISKTECLDERLLRLFFEQDDHDPQKFIADTDSFLGSLLALIDKEKSGSVLPSTPTKKKKASKKGSKKRKKKQGDKEDSKKGRIRGSKKKSKKGSSGRSAKGSKRSQMKSKKSKDKK